MFCVLIRETVLNLKKEETTTTQQQVSADYIFLDFNSSTSSIKLVIHYFEHFPRSASQNNFYDWAYKSQEI